MPAKGPARKTRLESLLKREIATIVSQELRDPRLGFVTVTRVELTSDLQNVTAYVTVLGEAAQRRRAMAALDAARGFVRSGYAKAVHTRLLPQLSFAYDDAEQRRGEMDALIRRARATDTDGGATPAPPAPDAEPR